MNKYPKIWQFVMKDFLSFKNYKAMKPFLAVLCALLVSPTIAIAFVLFGILYCLYFLFYIILVPGQFLLDFIKGEGNEVKHATQAVIYVIGFPFVMIFYVFAAIYVLSIHLVYFVFDIAVFYSSLAGIKIQPFLQLAKTDCVVDESKSYHKYVPVIFALIGWLLLILVFIFGYVVPIVAHGSVLAVSWAGIMFSLLLSTFIIIYVPIAFSIRHSPSEPKIKPIPEVKKPVEKKVEIAEEVSAPKISVHAEEKAVEKEPRVIESKPHFISSKYNKVILALSILIVLFFIATIITGFMQDSSFSSCANWFKSSDDYSNCVFYYNKYFVGYYMYGVAAFCIVLVALLASILCLVLEYRKNWQAMFKSYAFALIVSNLVAFIFIIVYFAFGSTLHSGIINSNYSFSQALTSFWNASRNSYSTMLISTIVCCLLYVAPLITMVIIAKKHKKHN